MFLWLQDEFLDVVYWFRQVIAMVLGVIWGVAPLKGFLGIAMWVQFRVQYSTVLQLMLMICDVSCRFCIINAGVLYVYFSSFQQVDEEEYGGTWELTKEGFMTSFALFLVDTCGPFPVKPDVLCLNWCQNNREHFQCTRVLNMTATVHLQTTLKSYIFILKTKYYTSLCTFFGVGCIHLINNR